MKVVCIDNKRKTYNIIWDREATRAVTECKFDNPLPLTIGKSYTISRGFVGWHEIVSYSPYYSIICDDGVRRELSSNRFITLEEWRESQLNKLNVEN